MSLANYRSQNQPTDSAEEAKNLRECGDGSGSVGEKAPQPLRHGDHPLPHRYRRDDVIGEMGGGLRHVPAIAGWAHPAPLARERDDKPLAAARTERTAEPETEDAAREIAAEFVLNVCRHGPLGGIPPGEPALQVLGDDFVERRLLGPPPLVTACGTASPRGAAGSPGARSGGS